MRRFRHLLPLVVLAGLAIAAWQSGLIAQLRWDTLARHQAALLASTAAHPVLAAAAYVGLYAAVVALAVPEASVVTVCGGLLFGTLVGGALAVIAATLGAVVLFLVARTALAEVMARRAGGVLERIGPRLRRDGFSYVLALRLVPAVPFWLINIGAALCGVRLIPYAAATLLGIIPGTFVFAWLGAGVGSVLAAGGRPDLALIFSPRILGPLLALALLALAPAILRRTPGRDG